MTTLVVRATHYITADESEPRWTGAKDYGLYRSDGTLLATVKRDFAQDLFTEGAGWLGDGRLVNTAGGCAYGEPLRGTPRQESSHQCWREITGAERARAPWGLGARGRPLVPLRTIATDQSLIPFGTVVTIPAFRGVHIQTMSAHGETFGGWTHDGLFVAGDTGSDINGAHIDIFTGTRAMMSALAHLVPADNLTISFERTDGGGSGGGARYSRRSRSGGGGAIVVLAVVAWLVLRRKK